MRLKEAKKAVSDFKKICSDKVMGLEIMLYYVENCIEFTNDYGDINKTFYNSATSVYSQIVKEINTVGCELYEKFAIRLRACIDATNSIGWGFHDELNDLYHELDWIDHESI